MTGKSHGDDPLSGVELSRRELIQKIVVGSAFALPVIASFDMAMLDPSSAYANNYSNQSPEPVFTSALAATFTVGTAQTFDIVTPGSAPMAVTETGKLPTGVIFTAINTNGMASTTDGTLSGTPAAGTGGVYPITLTATSQYFGTATQNFTLTVNEAPAFSSASAANVSVNGGATVNIKTTGYPLPTITLSGPLPTGMTFTPNSAAGTAAISGSPQATGTFALKLLATNDAGTATQTLVLTVQQAPTFTSAADATFSATASSSYAITTDGYPEATIALAGGLPAGLAFSAEPSTGSATISGKAKASGAGVHDLTLTAANGVSPNATQTLVLTVTPSDAFTTSNVKTTDTTQVNFDVTVPGPGTISANLSAPAGAASVAKKAAGRLTLARARVSVKSAKKVKLKTRPTAAGRRFVKSGDPRTELWLTVTYTPKHGKPASQTVKKLHLK